MKRVLHSVLFGLWALGPAAGCVSGASFAVDVGDNFFSPGATTIQVNDTVVWTWIGFNSHNVAHSSGTPPLWNTGFHGHGFSFSLQFTNAGSYPYVCTLHAGIGMVGSVTVQAAAGTPPTVAITNPANGAVLSAPASFTLAARALDSDGSVTNVQFFQGASSLGNVTMSPYAVPVNNLAAGSYTFSAVATDNTGLKATNSPEVTIHVVTPVPITLSAPHRLSPTSVEFSYTANPGLSYVVQRSAALSGFTPISTNTAASSRVTFTDTTATAARNFYRVWRLPNP